MHAQEVRRLAALHALGTLDTPADEAFDRLTALAAELFNTPVALVSLVDAERQWFKSRHGLEPSSTPREWSFCAHAIEMGTHAVMVVEDASIDPRFASNPLVTGHPDIRFYTGAVLTTRDGENIGTLCVIDSKPRARPSDAELARLELLARIVVDKFELVRTTRLAREKHRLLELAETTSGVGNWRYRLADGAVTWSDEVYRLHGVDRASFNPGYDDAVAFYHPDDQATVNEAIASAIATKAHSEFQLRIIRRDGEQRDVVAKAICELDDAGEVLAVFGIFQDITTQIRTLKAVQQSEKRYRLLADNMSDVITRMRLDGGSDYISPGIEQLLGYQPGEMTGRPAQAFVHVEDQAMIVQALSQMAKGTERLSLQHRAAHKDGHAVWVETGFQLVRDAEGKPVEIVAVIRDITDRKAMENALRAAQAEAEAAANVKAEFLANMSHELRTPLTAVLGFARLVEEQPELADTTRAYLGKVSNAGKALLSTVNDILDFSKLEAGQVEVKPQPISVGQLAMDTLDLFSAQTAEKGLSLTATGLDLLPGLVRADPDRLRQVLMNLIGNAVKFTEKGAISLEVSFDPQAQRLTFGVSDSGPGIPADRVDRLFQRFSQIDGGSTRRHGGTGLGLAICKGLVEAMGGEIAVESRLGEGARFWFWLPASALASRTADTTPVTTAGGLRGARVLLADDNPFNRELVCALLTPFGVEITEAADGLQAVELASRQPFDAILMDRRMPRLNGAGAARRIRDEDGLNAAIPIIAFSADPGQDDPPGLFDAVIAKPLTIDALVGGLAKALAWQGEGALDAAA